MAWYYGTCVCGTGHAVEMNAVGEELGYAHLAEQTLVICTHHPEHRGVMMQHEDTLTEESREAWERWREVGLGNAPPIGPHH